MLQVSFLLLFQLGLLQACDWLLGLKVTLWEDHERDDSVTQDICPGFYKDLETLSKLVLLVPSARSRVSCHFGLGPLYKGLIEGSHFVGCLLNLDPHKGFFKLTCETSYPLQSD